MSDNNIILITNDNSVVDVLKPRLVLLREVDAILAIPYNIALEKLENSLPETVLVYCSETDEEECLNLIKKIKANPKAKHISILLIVENINSDFILSAYDEGIADYMRLKSDDIEVLIRAIWSFQKNATARKLHEKVRLLKKLNIVNKQTGFYNNEYCKPVFENISEIMNDAGKESIIMLVGLAQESKLTTSFDSFVAAVKLSIRNTDIVMHSVNERVYILLTRTQLKSAFFILERIKNALHNQARVLASVTSAKDKKFEDIASKLLSGLCEVEGKGEDLIILDEEKKNESSQDWLDKMNSSQKNFKLFKQAFAKKLEKVITPVFFQMQKVYEERLFQTTIEQYSTSNISEFILKNGENVSNLRITYPGFSKINLDFLHKGFDSPEDKRISLDLSELTEENLTKCIEKFIAEFKANLKEG